MKHLNTIKLQATKKSTLPEKIFTGYLSDSFPNITEKVIDRTIDIQEIEKDGTFKDFFLHPEKQVMTIGEITEFCKNHQDQLRTDGWYTFFLLKKEGEYFVALVRFDVRARKLEVCVDRFSRVRVWSASFRPRIVSLQLEPQSPSPEMTLRNSDTLPLSSKLEKTSTTYSGKNFNITVNNEVDYPYVSVSDSGEPTSGFLKHWGTPEKLISELQEVINELKLLI